MKALNEALLRIIVEGPEIEEFIKDTLKAFNDFKNKQQKCMK